MATSCSLLDTGNYPEHEWHFARLYTSSGALDAGFYMPNVFRATVLAPDAAAWEAPRSACWRSGLGRRHPHWLLFVFPGEVELAGLRLFRTQGETTPCKYYLEGSDDGGETFRRVLTCDKEIPRDTLCAEHAFEPMRTTAVRLVITESACRETPDACHLQSLQLLGRVLRIDSGPPPPVDGLRSDPDLSRRHIGEPYAQTTIENGFCRIGVGVHMPVVTELRLNLFGSLAEAPPLLFERGRNVHTGSGALIEPLDAPAALSETGSSGDLTIDAQALEIADVDVGPHQTVGWRFEMREDEVAIVLHCERQRRLIAVESAALRLALNAGADVMYPLAIPDESGGFRGSWLLSFVNYGHYVFETDAADLVTYSCGTRADRTLHLDFKLGEHRRDDGLWVLEPGRFEATIVIRPWRTPMAERLAPPASRAAAAIARSWMAGIPWCAHQRYLCNHIVSDPVALNQHMYARQALLTPVLPTGVDPLEFAAASLGGLAAGRRPWGRYNELVMWMVKGWPRDHAREWQEPGTSAALVMAAYYLFCGRPDLAETEDFRRFWRREADLMIEVDRDGDGLIESFRDGRGGTQLPPSFMDDTQSGHIDPHSNAFAYRAFLNAAELEGRFGDEEHAQRYRAAAARIKAVFWDAFYLPDKGWLAGWIDVDGRPHDACYVWANGPAMIMGVLTDEQAATVASGLAAQLERIGRDSWPWGMPLALAPIPPHDIKGGKAARRKDGHDRYGYYEHGAITTSYISETVTGLFRCGQRQAAGKIMDAILETIARGELSGGEGSGIDWRTWDGVPTGYEGTLADQYEIWASHVQGYLGGNMDFDGIAFDPACPQERLAGKRFTWQEWRTADW